MWPSSGCGVWICDTLVVLNTLRIGSRTINNQLSFTLDIIIIRVNNHDNMKLLRVPIRTLLRIYIANESTSTSAIQVHAYLDGVTYGPVRPLIKMEKKNCRKNTTNTIDREFVTTEV